jgi:hypothetical protein
VPGLVGSIPMQSSHTIHIKDSEEFLSYIDRGALGLFLISGAQIFPRTMGRLGGGFLNVYDWMIVTLTLIPIWKYIF